MRNHPLKAAHLPGSLKRLTYSLADLRLTPLVWRLGEDLNRGRPDRHASSGRLMDTALGGDVRAEAVVCCLLDTGVCTHTFPRP